MIFGKLNTFRPEVSNGFLGDPPSRPDAEFTAQASGPWGPFEAEKDGLEVQRSTRVKSASNRAMRYRHRVWKPGSSAK